MKNNAKDEVLLLATVLVDSFSKDLSPLDGHFERLEKALAVARRIVSKPPTDRASNAKKNPIRCRADTQLAEAVEHIRRLSSVLGSDECTIPADEFIRKLEGCRAPL